MERKKEDAEIQIKFIQHPTSGTFLCLSWRAFFHTLAGFVGADSCDINLWVYLSGIFTISLLAGKKEKEVSYKQHPQYHG